MFQRTLQDFCSSLHFIVIYSYNMKTFLRVLYSSIYYLVLNSRWSERQPANNKQIKSNVSNEVTIVDIISTVVHVLKFIVM